jgi:2-phospho-L-lactate guanylyltransferase
MKYTALIPVKTLALAKSRLAAHLSQGQRARLVLDMLQHVIQTLNESELFEQVYVVSADPQVLELVQHWDAEPLWETRQGHNPALQAAAQTILERAAWRHGLAGKTQRDNFGLLTISADLPLLTQEDIRALIAQAERTQVVLAGSRDGTGTNAVLMRPPLVLPYLFGPHSLPAYIQAARQRQIGYTLVENANLALDIDTLDDLQILEQRSHAWSSMASLAM